MANGGGGGSFKWFCWNLENSSHITHVGNQDTVYVQCMFLL